MKILKLTLVLTAFGLFAIACNQTATNNATTNAIVVNAANTTAKTEPTAQSDELAAARIHYSDKCASCHKENGTGGKIEVDGKIRKADDLTTEKMKKMDDAKYVKYIKDGIPDEGMPAFKDHLSDEEIKTLVKFIRKEIQKN